MNKELQQLECLLQISTAIIDTPTFSIANFGIGKDNNTNQLTYTGLVDYNVKKDYAYVAAASIGLAGAAVITTSTVLSATGLGAGAVAVGSVVAAGGASATGIGLIVAPLILWWGYRKYKEKKREQEEKDRIYKELIAKQQAAINRQKQINRILEEKLREQNSIVEQLRKEIVKLTQEINNLIEIIDILTTQINQFKKAV